jgi:Ca2+-binding EF-hand superfamily protein
MVISAVVSGKLKQYDAEEEELIHQEEIAEENKLENIRAEFGLYDLNGDGLVDALDIRGRFKQQIDAAMLAQFFSDTDFDESGTVTFDEYSAYRRNLLARSTSST